jgi:hypothetical protein
VAWDVGQFYVTLLDALESLLRLHNLDWRIVMSKSKQKKGNREAKKPKAQSDETKKQKKDPNRYDSL